MDRDTDMATGMDTDTGTGRYMYMYMDRDTDKDVDSDVRRQDSEVLVISTMSHKISDFRINVSSVKDYRTK